ncbi:MAG: hypothetical protein ABJH63_07265 [Rhizobiaceae bacterium]
MEAFQAFDADVQKLPQWVQIWVDIIGFSLMVSTVALLIGSTTRKLGLYVLFTIVATVAIMTVLHAQMGMVRLLGIVHVVLWTPMVIVLWRRLKSNPPTKIYAAAIILLMVISVLALIFDYYDVVRWMLGERAPIV